MEEALRLNEFFIEGGNPERSQVIVHITEPSTRDEQEKGIFFVLCELSGSTPDFTQELEKTIEDAQQIYYQSTGSPEQAFEKALDNFNKKSIALQRPYIKLECALGVLVQNSILFAFCGRPIIVLFYKNREGKYLELDLVTTNLSSENESTATVQGFFTQLIQGKITPGDYIFIGSSKSQTALKGDQFRQLITTRSPKESALLIERGLQGIPSDNSYGGLVISLSKTPTTPIPLYRTPRHGSAASLQHFFSTEQKTNETLSSSIGQHIGNKLQSTIDNLHQSHERINSIVTPAQEETNYIPPRARVRESIKKPHHSRTNSSRAPSTYLLLTISYIGKGILAVGAAIKAFLSYCGIFLLNLATVLTNFRNRRALILDGWKRTLRSYQAYFLGFSLLTKLLFIVSTVLCIVFIISIAHIHKNQRIVAEQKQFEETLKTVSNHLDSAEAALIYNNASSAREEIENARKILLSANESCRTQSRQNQCNSIAQRIDEIGRKARNIVTVDQQTITTFAGLDQARMLKINTLIMVYSPVSSSIFTYNLLTKESEYLTTTSSGFRASAVPKENDYALFLTDDKTLVSFNPKDRTFKYQTLSLPESTLDHEISSLLVYNRRLYSLDAATGQLYRHETIRSGFATGKEWIKNGSIDTRGAKDVTIDGDIYILLPNGTVKKFTDGSSQEFAITNIDPPLVSGTRIFTYTDLTYLYVLDTAEKRLLILEKNGKLVKQITSTSFTQPTDMIIDEASKTAYIIDGTAIVRISL